MSVQATGSLPVLSFQVAFTGTKNGQTVGADPNDPTITPNWTDLTDRLVQLQTRRGKSYELDEATAAEHQFTLANADGALDPTNTAGPYYPNVLPYRQYRLLVTWQGTQYTVSSGFIETWPMTWKHAGMYGWVTCLGVDAIAALSQIVLPSCLKAEVMLDAPYAYYPMDEASPAAQAGPYTQTGAGPLVPVQYGTGGAYTFGGTTLTTLVGAGASVSSNSNALQGNTTGVAFAPTNSSDGIALQVLFPGQEFGTPSGITLEGWYQGTQVSGSICCASDGTYNYAVLWVNSSGQLQATCTDYTGVNVTCLGPVVTDGKLHHVAVTCSAGAALTANLYLDGALQNTRTSSPAILKGFPCTGLALGAQADSQPHLFNATVCHVAVYQSILTAARLADHWHAGVDGFPETSGARFQRILSYAPWNLGSVVPTGDTNLMGCIDIDGKSALRALLDVCQWENGNLYADNMGRVVFENRHARMTQLNQAWVMGENNPAQPQLVIYGYQPQGTFSAFGTDITDNGDGTFTANGPGVTDNGNGTFTMNT